MTNEQQVSYNALIGAFQVLANAHIQIVQGPQPPEVMAGKADKVRREDIPHQFEQDWPQPTKEHNYDADIPNSDNHSGDSGNA